jgi:hypothetical protein
MGESNGTALAVHQPQSYAAPLAKTTPGAFALEPTNFDEGMRLAKVVVDSGMFGVKNAADAFVRMSTGMGLGLTAVQSLRGVYVISGKPGISSDLMMALCLRLPECEYFRPAETTATVARFEAKRRGDPKPITMDFTFDEAKAAGLTSNAMYQKYPKNMLRARCIANLARLAFPEAVHGLYIPDELRTGEVASDIDAEIVAEVSGAPVVYAEPEVDIITAAAIEVEKRLNMAETIEDVDAVSTEYGPKFKKAKPDVRARIKTMFDTARARITDAIKTAQAQVDAAE